MDSLSQYTTSASKGGPAGEILVRKCLTSALIDIWDPIMDIASSDEEMEMKGRNGVYDVYIFDPWTWAGKGWVLRSFIDPGKLFLLDFFGTENSYMPGGSKAGGIKNFDADNRVLRAYPNLGTEGKGQFLGFYLPPITSSNSSPLATGENAKVVIWGKDPKYFTPPTISIIRELTSTPGVTVTTTLPPTSPVPLPTAVQRTGHLTPSQYHDLLLDSTHLMGLGHPLLGPSAVEGVSYGCVLLNPTYDKDVKGFSVQHPYVKEYVGRKNCEYSIEEGVKGVTECLEKRAGAGVPMEYTEASYKERVKGIFGGALGQ